MKPDEADVGFVLDMLEACREVQSFVAGKDPTPTGQSGLNPCC